MENQITVKRKLIRNMKNLNFILILLALPLFFVRCGQVDQTKYGSVDKMIMEHQKDAPYISAAHLNEMISEQTPGIRIVDVREPDEYAAGHIPGSVNVPRGLLEFSDLISNRREQLYIYSNNQNRAVLSVESLKLTKHSEVTVLQGGFENWKTTYPELIEEGSGAPASSAPAKQASSGGCGG
jgi:rhodanese-related sulfurtransferase